MKKKIANPDPFSLECSIQGFDGTYAILQNGDSAMGQIRWPIHRLPEKIQPGQKITLKAVPENAEHEGQYQIMRQLLEEIVN